MRSTAIATATATALVALLALAAAAADANECVVAALAAPSGLRLKRVSADGAEVAWRAPSGLCVDSWSYVAVPTAAAPAAAKDAKGAKAAPLPARSEIKCAPPPPRSGDAPRATSTASAVLTGLKPATEYRFLVSGANAKGASPDGALVFTTKAA